MSERNNVLLVVLDSVRAENTSLHGYDRETTPFLSDFADRSTVYTQARAPGIHSIASHVSMFTGKHVEEHKAIHHTTQIDLSQTIWHELRTEFGYATGLFTNNQIVSDASNLGAEFEYHYKPDYPLAERLENRIDGTRLERIYFRGYDALSRLVESIGTARNHGSDETDTPRETPSETVTEDRTQTAQERTTATSQPRPTATSQERSTAGRGLSDRLSGRVGKLADAAGLSSGYKTLFGGTFTDAFLEWERRQDGPWAACINLMDAHSPYEPKSEFDRWADERNWQIQREEKPTVRETLRGRGWEKLSALEPLYDGAIRQADAIVRELVAELETRDLLSETLLIVTSDHGEAFGERSRLNEAVRLRDHKWGIHEALTHVPLVVSYPEKRGGSVVEEPVSLTDTPAVIRTAATDGDGNERLTESDVVLSSTFRLPEQKRSKYSSIDDIERYMGPWRAVYEPRDGTVYKFAQKDTRHATVEIDAAGDSSVLSRDAHDRVAEEYTRLTDSDLVTQKTTEIDDELEERLEDLGYIR